MPVKRKKSSGGAKGSAVRKHQREPVCDDPLTLFATYLGRPDALRRVFAKPDSGRVKDGCIGNCIPCRKKRGCDIYQKIKGCFSGPGKSA